MWDRESYVLRDRVEGALRFAQAALRRRGFHGRDHDADELSIGGERGGDRRAPGRLAAHDRLLGEGEGGERGVGAAKPRADLHALAHADEASFELAGGRVVEVDREAPGANEPVQDAAEGGEDRVDGDVVVGDQRDVSDRVEEADPAREREVGHAQPAGELARLRARAVGLRDGARGAGSGLEAVEGGKGESEEGGREQEEIHGEGIGGGAGSA